MNIATKMAATAPTVDHQSQNIGFAQHNQGQGYPPPNQGQGYPHPQPQYPPPMGHPQNPYPPQPGFHQQPGQIVITQAPPIITTQPGKGLTFYLKF